MILRNHYRLSRVPSAARCCSAPDSCFDVLFFRERGDHAPLSGDSAVRNVFSVWIGSVHLSTTLPTQILMFGSLCFLSCKLFGVIFEPQPRLLRTFQGKLGVIEMIESCPTQPDLNQVPKNAVLLSSIQISAVAVAELGAEHRYMLRGPQSKRFPNRPQKPWGRSKNTCDTNLKLLTRSSDL